MSVGRQPDEVLAILDGGDKMMKKWRPNPSVSPMLSLTTYPP